MLPIELGDFRAAPSVRMESISVRQRLRPVRYCFGIAPDDHESFVRAAALNTVLWGGIYNPIVHGVEELAVHAQFEQKY